MAVEDQPGAIFVQRSDDVEFQDMSENTRETLRRILDQHDKILDLNTRIAELVGAYRLVIVKTSGYALNVEGPDTPQQEG